MHTTPTCGTPQPLWPAAARLGEGLCWSPREQAIWWVDIHGQRLMRLHPATGRQAHWDFDETISAVAERAREPGLVVALRHRIALFDPDTQALRTLHDVEPDLPGNRLNDGKCDAQGRFWVGSMDDACTHPTGSLYCASEASRAGPLSPAWPVRFPVFNGPAWSPDGRTMWVNDTARNAIHRCGFDPGTGAIGRSGVWLRFAKGDGYPDGMTTDREGRLWVAHWDGGCVTCHAADDGRELARVMLPTSNITNVAFGGPDLATLFITSATADLSDAQSASQPLAGALFAVTTDAVGIAPHCCAL